MENKNVLKEIDIKNCACWYFDDIINGTDIYFSDIFLEEKLYENISVYEILYKISMGPKPLRIRFDKVDGFIMVLDGKIKHFVLLDYELFDKLCDKISYKLKYNFLPILFNIEKISTFDNVIILMKSIVNKNKNNYYYNVFLEKSSYKDKSNAQYF